MSNPTWVKEFDPGPRIFVKILLKLESSHDCTLRFINEKNFSAQSSSQIFLKLKKERSENNDNKSFDYSLAFILQLIPVK